MTIPQNLPGSSLVEAGLRDAAAGVESTAALLVAIGAPRLRELGYHVPIAWPDPEHRLYTRLADEFGPDAAHSQHNSLIRQLRASRRVRRLATAERIRAFLDRLGQRVEERVAET